MLQIYSSRCINLIEQTKTFLDLSNQIPKFSPRNIFHFKSCAIIESQCTGAPMKSIHERAILSLLFVKKCEQSLNQTASFNAAAYGRILGGGCLVRNRIWDLLVTVPTLRPLHHGRPTMMNDNDE